MSTGCIAAYNCISVNQDGTLDPCCQYTRAEDFKPFRFTEFKEYQQAVQQSMHEDALNGRPHPGCQKCYREEEAGWRTVRKLFEGWYSKDASTVVSADNPLYDIELRLGNFCNLNCIMCQPDASSSIALELGQHRVAFESIGVYAGNGNPDYYWETKQFDDFSEQLLKDARRVSITGGEPFIIPEVLKILRRLTAKAETVSLMFNTNLTRVSDKLLDHLRPFKKLTIAVSLEGIGDMNDYLRYPSRWDDIVTNLARLREAVPTAEIMVNHTFQNSSVYSLPGLAQYCTDNRLYLNMTLVQGADMLTLDSVPTETLAQFRSWTESADCLGPKQRQLVLTTIDNAHYNSALHDKFTKYVNLLDSIRGTSYQNVFGLTT